MESNLAILLLIIIILIYWMYSWKKKCLIKTTFRKLWFDHGMYTRIYIISYLNDLPDTKLISIRLLKNQEDIGNFVSQVYGQRKGDILTDILKKHILGAVEILKDLKLSDSKKLDIDIKNWYQNGNEIANILGNINEKWRNCSDMIKEHLDLTIQETQQYKNGHYEQSIQTFDQIIDELMKMSDYFTKNM